MAGSFKKLYEEDVSSVSEVTIQHDLDRVVCAVRFCTNGAIRNDLVKSIVPSEDDPRNKIKISFTETISSGNIQIVDSNYIWSTLPSPEGASRLENYGGMVIAQKNIFNASSTTSNVSLPTSMAEASSGFSITFVAPSNGKVSIQISAFFAHAGSPGGTDVSEGRVRVALHDGNGYVYDTDGVQLDSQEFFQAAGDNYMQNIEFVVAKDGNNSALVPGQEYTFTAYFERTQDIRIYYGSNYLPFIMKAVTVPNTIS